MANAKAITLLASGTQTAAGDGSAVDLGETVGDYLVLRSAVQVVIPVTAFALESPAPPDPEPVLTLSIETRDATADPWETIVTLEIEATGRYTLSAGDLGRYVRLSWELGVGLESVDFGATGQAHVVYCDPRDLTKTCVPERSVADITASARADACISASDEADGYIGGAYTLPLLAWPNDLRDHTARIATGIIFAHRGVDPQGPDANVLLERDRALKWLDRLANGRLSPPGLIDSTEDVFEGGSVVISIPSRLG